MYDHGDFFVRLNLFYCIGSESPCHITKNVCIAPATILGARSKYKVILKHHRFIFKNNDDTLT